MTRIGVLTGGGDVPGLNPCIKTIVYAAVDERENGRIDVYYGMADSRIGAATTSIPGNLEREGEQ